MLGTYSNTSWFWEHSASIWCHHLVTLPVRPGCGYWFLGCTSGRVNQSSLFLRLACGWVRLISCWMWYTYRVGILGSACGWVDQRYCFLIRAFGLAGQRSRRLVYTPRVGWSARCIAADVPIGEGLVRVHTVQLEIWGDWRQLEATLGFLIWCAGWLVYNGSEGTTASVRDLIQILLSNNIYEAIRLN